MLDLQPVDRGGVVVDVFDLLPGKPNNNVAASDARDFCRGTLGYVGEFDADDVIAVAGDGAKRLARRRALPVWAWLNVSRIWEPAGRLPTAA